MTALLIIIPRRLRALTDDCRDYRQGRQSPPSSSEVIHQVLGGGDVGSHNSATAAQQPLPKCLPPYSRDELRARIRQRWSRSPGRHEELLMRSLEDDETLRFGSDALSSRELSRHGGPHHQISSVSLSVMTMPAQH